MLRKNISILFAICVLLTSFGIADQKTTPLGTGIGILGGYATYPDQNNVGSAAYGLSLTLGITKNIAIELVGLPSNPTITGSPGGLDAGKLKTVPIQLNIQFRYPVTDQFAYYLNLGGGLYLNTFNIDSTVASSWQNLGFSINEKVNNSFGFQVGGGFDFFATENFALGPIISYSFSNTKGSRSMTENSTGIVTSGTIDNIKLNSLFIGIRMLVYIFK
jgi:outer membrane protein W